MHMWFIEFINRKQIEPIKDNPSIHRHVYNLELDKILCVHALTYSIYCTARNDYAYYI